MPEDLSIIGIDDFVLSGVLGLTTVRQDVAGQGHAAADLLLRALLDDDESTETIVAADRARRARVDRPSPPLSPTLCESPTSSPPRGASRWVSRNECGQLMVESSLASSSGSRR